MKFCKIVRFSEWLRMNAYMYREGKKNSQNCSASHYHNWKCNSYIFYCRFRVSWAYQKAYAV